MPGQNLAHTMSGPELSTSPMLDVHKPCFRKRVAKSGAYDGANLKVVVLGVKLVVGVVDRTGDAGLKRNEVSESQRLAGLRNIAGHYIQKRIEDVLNCRDMQVQSGDLQVFRKGAEIADSVGGVDDRKAEFAFPIGTAGNWRYVDMVWQLTISRIKLAVVAGDGKVRAGPFGRHIGVAFTHSSGYHTKYKGVRQAQAQGAGDK